jgi:lysylphosphatidylglycerol synthase-like protein
MISGLSHKTKQFFFVLIKLSIIVSAAYFIYDKLTNNQKIDFDVFIAFLTKNAIFSTKTVVFLLFLTIFNWFFEILKWKNLVGFVQNISFFEALKQSLASHTASLFTPNRIGDYGAKAMYFESSMRKRILFLNLISNTAQMFATLLFGCFGFIFFVNNNNVNILYYRFLSYVVFIVAIITFIILRVSYKRLSLKGIPLYKIKDFIKSISARIHIKNVLFSILRYLIFSFQFYYLLLLFGTDFHYFEAMIMITTMYLLVSIIPTIFVFDVVVKGGIAIYLFSFVGIDELTILSITMLMWLFNFVLPSVLGSLYVLNFSYSKLINPISNLE